jgi:NAD(P)-dependent dehydrogenase (short-subunit alcohol dehydrogenase family)
MALLQEGSRASELVAHYAQSVKGKTILTTGVTPGSIGAAYVEALAGASPALLILVGRSVDKLEKEAAVIASEHPEIPTRNLVADLGSFESVRKAAAEVNSWKDVEKIDIVMNSAGIMATPYRLSVDGYESQFATNHLGHFLLTNLIMDKILASDAPRVVNFTSDGHRLGFMRWADLNFDVSYSYRLFLP